jgi:hypothetical protein
MKSLIWLGRSLHHAAMKQWMVAVLVEGTDLLPRTDSCDSAIELLFMA